MSVIYCVLITLIHLLVQACTAQFLLLFFRTYGCVIPLCKSMNNDRANDVRLIIVANLWHVVKEYEHFNLTNGVRMV